jgi:hypothetical protein
LDSEEPDGAEGVGADAFSDTVGFFASGEGFEGASAAEDCDDEAAAGFDAAPREDGGGSTERRARMSRATACARGATARERASWRVSMASGMQQLKEAEQKS